MSTAKLVVLYPYPTDRAAFDKVYADEHAPLMLERSRGWADRIVVTKVLGTPEGAPGDYYVMAEVYFYTLEKIAEFFGTSAGQEVAQNAVKISSGGVPKVLITEEDTYTL